MSPEIGRWYSAGIVRSVRVVSGELKQPNPPRILDFHVHDVPATSCLSIGPTEDLVHVASLNDPVRVCRAIR